MYNSKIAFIILHYNDLHVTKRCLKSIEQFYENSAVYLVDNSLSNEGALLKDEISNTKYFKLNKNLGYAAGNNFGISRAVADGFEYFVIINNDIIFIENIIDHLIQNITDDPDIGIATCKLLYNDNKTIYSSGGRYNRLLCAGENINNGKADENQKTVSFNDFIPGALFICKKEVIEKVGYIDEEYFMYFEDLDFSFRVINAGFKIFYSSHVKAIHDCKTAKKGIFYTPLYLYYHTRNRLWIFKHQSRLYFMYVIVYSVLNCLFKTSVVLKNNDNKYNSLKNLWRGLLHGIIHKKGVHSQRV